MLIVLVLTSVLGWLKSSFGFFISRDGKTRIDLLANLIPWLCKMVTLAEMEVKSIQELSVLFLQHFCNIPE